MNCRNCGKVFYDEYAFCPECGQKANEKLNLKILFSDTVGNYLSADSRIFKSFYPLLFKPGYLAKIYVSGKRSLFLHPARFYLFISIIFFALFSLVDSTDATSNSDSDLIDFNINNEKVSLDSLENVNIEDSISLETGFLDGDIIFSRKTIDSLNRNNASIDEKIRSMGYDGQGAMKRYFFTQSLLLYENKGKGFKETIYQTLPASLFFMLPLFAGLLYLFHRKKGPYSYHLVFSFYYFTFAFVILTILVLISAFWNMSAWLNFLIIILLFIHLVFGIAKFYNQRKRTSFFKSSIILFIFNLFIIPSTIIIALTVSFFLYK